MTRNLRKIFSLLIIVLSAAQAATGAPIDEARRLYREGNYEQAVEKLRVIVKRSPRDGNANYFLGASLYELGRTGEAIKPLTTAEGRGVGQASELLARIAIEEYRADDASEHLDAWAASLKKSKKQLPDSYDEMSSRVVGLKNMLERVEKIEIVDSLVVDSADFFRHYRLSSAAGSLLPAREIAGAEEDGVMFVPENRRELLWSRPGDDGLRNICSAAFLDDGTIESPTPSDPPLGEGGDAAFPFMMPDGMTLYFANNGENSLGGYDIFMTRRNDDGTFFQPQNVGMPYNSPYDDYMLAIDEASGLGWFATDRNRIPGKVMIYVFLPSETRVNCDPDDENLTSLAKLSDIGLTRREGVDYKALLEEKLPAPASETAKADHSPRFELDLGNGRIYTSMDQFRNKDARRTMLQLLAAEVNLRKLNEKLDALREKYRKGDRSVSAAILSGERERESLYREIRTTRNKVVRLETRN